MPETDRTVLVIDDDRNMRWAVRTILEQSGFVITEAAAGSRGLEVAARCAPDAVVLDIEMPDMNGQEVLRHLRYRHRDVPVIVMTAFGTIPGAIAAIRTGAFEYLTKPFCNDLLVDAVRRAVARGRGSSKVRGTLTATMGASPAVHALADEVEAVIATDYSVLIRGETGAGKEVVARCLHERGPRAQRQLVVVDCGSLVESLIDSAFFGHEKGAYTGAAARRGGWFEAAAAGGTIFLDEIGNLSLAGQKALLRVLEERVIYRIGSTTPIRLDLRVLAATNETLEERTQAGGFREDLLYRLAEYVITVPALRERPEDIEYLAQRFLGEASAALGRASPDFAPGALDLLRRHDWPGNVRELRNIVRRVALGAASEITAAEVARCLSRRNATATHDASRDRAAPLRRRVQDRVRELEREAILDALGRASGNKAEAARLLGIDYKTYRTKLKTLTRQWPAGADAAY